MEQQSEKDDEYNNKIIQALADIQIKHDEIAAELPARLPNTVAQTGSVPNIQLKLPGLKIVRFSDNSSNLFAFFQFKSSFINAMESISGVALTTKLVCLKSYLSGRALTLIENLPITDENYVAA